jgi:hypothetical protein
MAGDRMAPGMGKASGSDTPQLCKEMPFSLGEWPKPPFTTGKVWHRPCSYRVWRAYIRGSIRGSPPVSPQWETLP